MSIVSSIQKLQERMPLTVKLTALIIALGGLLLLTLYNFHTNTLREDFQAQLIRRLELEAVNDRQHFHRQMKTHEEAVRTFAALKPFLDYIKKDEWSKSSEVRTYTEPPAWYPPRPVVRLFSPLRFALLLDAQGAVRETYQPVSFHLPDELLHISRFLVAISTGQSYLTSFNRVPYIISTQPVRGPDGGLRASLVLTTPIDDYFLTSILETETPGHAVVLMSTGEKQEVISSSNNRALPPGALLSDINRDYLITGKEFFDYGASDLEFRFASLIPREQLEVMTETATRSARNQYVTMALVYIAVFLLIMLYITRNIRRLTTHVVAFQQKILGTRSGITTSGDELLILNRNFNALMNEVVRSHEQIRREASEQTRLIVDNAFDAVVAMDERGAVTTWNPAAERLFGWKTEEVMQRKLWEVVLRPGDQAHLKDALDRFRARGDDSLFGKPMGLSAVSKDNTSLQLEATFTSVRQSEQYTFIGILRDVTERKQLEEQLMQAQKMESVGRLAGGIAHDFNNTLTAIIGFSEVMLNEMDEQDPQRRYVQTIYDAGNSAADLVTQLLAFSRKQIIAPKVMNLNEAIRNMDQLLLRLLGENIEKEILLEPALWNIRADATQVEQVIINLAVNAKDAMAGNGRLCLETSNVALDEDYVKSQFDISPGEYIMLAVSDTGHGLDEEQKKHIFEPFYTTKEKGKGTGLGLATVFGIVKHGGGDIHVYSEPGSGTTFKIYWPRAVETQNVESETAHEGPLRGTETILLIEDEKDVRRLATESLSSYGYTVMEAVDGEDALSLYARYHGNIDLLLTDVIMPKMNGNVVAEKLKTLNPSLKVLFMSGYTENAIVHHGILDERVNFIQKPITPKRLAKAVRKALDS